MSTSDLAHRVSVEAAEARALLQMVAETIVDDDDMAATVIEGETNLFEAVSAAVDRVAELESHASAISHQVEAMRDRKARFDAAAERLRGALRSALETTDQKRLELPRATVSLRAVAPKLQIIDEAAIPADCLRHRPPEIDKRVVLSLLKSGVAVPGAAMSNGGTTIAIEFR